MRRGGGNPVDRAGIHHDRARPGVDGARIRRQERVLQVADRQLGLQPVVPVDRLGIPGEVLHGSGDLQAVAAGALQAGHERAAQRGGQRGLFGPGLIGAAPPVVPRQVLDGGEVPVPPGGSQPVGGHPAAGHGRGRIPGRAHADGLREQRRLPRVPEAVHGVDTEDDRDVQPRVLDRVGLHGVVLVGPVQARIAGTALSGRVGWDVGPAGQDRANAIVDEDLLLTHRVGHVEGALAGAGVAGVSDLRHLDLHHLADLLRQSHLAEQAGDPSLDRRARTEVGQATAGRGGGRCRRGYGCQRANDERHGHHRGSHWPVATEPRQARYAAAPPNTIMDSVFHGALLRLCHR